MEQTNSTDTAIAKLIEVLRHEIYPREMRMMLFILLLMVVLGLAVLLGFNLRAEPSERAIAEAEASMAYRCLLVTERLQLERDLQSINAITGGRQDDILRQANDRIDAWILRRYNKDSSRHVSHEESDGWARKYLASVADFRAKQPRSDNSERARAVNDVLKRARAMEPLAGVK